MHFSAMRRVLALCAVAAGSVAAVATPAMATAPAVVGPGTCAPNTASVTISVDRSQPSLFCYSGHGTSPIGASDVFHFFAGASTTGSFRYDFGNNTCGNTFSFLPFQQNDFPTAIHICSGWHIN